MRVNKDLGGDYESFSYWQATADQVTLSLDLPSAVDAGGAGSMSKAGTSHDPAL